MAFHLHRAERTDLLAYGLGALLSNPLDDPFADELVIVPAKGVERWLSQRLSHILGRGKDLVISGGFNVYPKEIESEIDAMPGVIESAVIGVPHADFGEGVTAVVVCNTGADFTEAGVLKALDGRLAKFKMPKRVFVVDELPRNAMGKVQKNILRDTYKDIYTKN